MHYQSSYFSSDANAEKIASTVCDEKVKRLDDDNQCQSYQEALSWIAFSGKEVDEFYFKADHISMQLGIEIHGSKGKDSAMKEMKNLTLKILILDRQNMQQ